MKLTEWRRQQVKALLEQGKDAAAISQALRFPLSVIEADVRLLAPTRWRDEITATVQARRAEVARLAGGMSVKAMATQLGVVPMTIYSDLRTLGLARPRGAPKAKAARQDGPLRTRQPRPHGTDTRREAVAALAATMSVDALAAALGRTRQTIERDLKALGLAPLACPRGRPRKQRPEETRAA